jgi:TRAP-type C4-dicarboxylate transport system permease small subunit
MFVIGGFACAMMVCFGIVHMWDCIINGVTDVRAVTVPKSAVFIIIPIGFILLTLQFFRMAWSRFIDISS